LADTMKLTQLNVGLELAKIVGINPNVIDRHTAAWFYRSYGSHGEAHALRNAAADRNKAEEYGLNFKQYTWIPVGDDRHSVVDDDVAPVEKKAPWYKRIFKRPSP